MARDGDKEQGANAASERGGATAYGDRPSFRPARAEPLLTRALPLSADLPRYRVPSAGRDLVAGRDGGGARHPVGNGLRASSPASRR